MPALTAKAGLRVGGVTPFTTVDFPGQLAAAVFVQGCPWRCGYCHNPHLQPRVSPPGAMTWCDVLNLLQRRQGLIDAVVFSGGEPTIDTMLGRAILDVRNMGYNVGLHSGGIYPDRLKAILPLIDWVGFDVKASFQDYDSITQVKHSGDPARRSLNAILEYGIKHECRTTIHPALHSNASIDALAHHLAEMGVQDYALQVFRPQGCNDSALNNAGLAGYPDPELVARLENLFPHFTLRKA